MSDPADEADQQVERFNDFARSLRRPTGPMATGYCAWCDDPVAAGVRFCDVGCRDDWDRDEARRSTSVADA